ncbi:MAG: DUF721 domain-containing protein [Deinococcales bacterium]
MADWTRMPPPKTTFKPKLRQNRVGGLKPLGQVLERVVERKGWKRSFEKMRILAAWDEVVGYQLARTTKAIELRKDRESRETVMLVRVQDNTAADFFSRNSPLYLEKLRQALGEATPKRLQFSVGALEVSKAQKPFQVPRLSGAEKNRLAQALPPSPEGIRASVQAAAEAMYLVRLERQKKGFVPCPICNTLTPKPEPCQYCRAVLRDAGVQHKKIQLVRNPNLLAHFPPDEITECARYLALEYLLEQLQTLALQSLHQAPEMHYYLELTAKAYLALLLRSKLEQIGRQDWRNLPEGVRGVLEAK